MCVKLSAKVWAMALPSSEKLVLLALADKANVRKGNTAWPSIASISKLTGLSERTVQGAIKTLCASGNITRREVVGKGAVYTVHPRSDCTPANAAPPQNLQDTPAATAPKPLKEPLVVSASALTILPARKSEYPDAFEIVWKAYPRHDGKGAALKAWQSACKRTGQPDRILAAVNDYAANPPNDANFIPHMATWLNQSRYDDERQTDATRNRPICGTGQPGRGGNVRVNAALDLHAEALERERREAEGVIEGDGDYWGIGAAVSALQ